MQLASVARDDAAEETDVDMALAFGAMAFLPERCRLGGGGNAVERHVDERRDAARQRGARRRREALPFGATRLVDVYVGVDESRQDDEVASIEDLDRARAARVVDVGDAHDAPAGHVQRRRPHSLRRDYTLPAHDTRRAWRRPARIDHAVSAQNRRRRFPATVRR